MLRMAVPLALAELGWMAMGLEDTIMAGRLGAAALGAGSLGAMLFYPIAICGTGLLLGMDTLVAQAHGARDAADCRRTLVNGVMAEPGAGAVVGAGDSVADSLLRATGTNPNGHGAVRSVPEGAGMGPCRRCSSMRPSAATCKPSTWSSR
jgi:multidrug resistance protein, MATE family